MGWGLMLWLGPPWFNKRFVLALAGGVYRISQEYSSFYSSDKFDFCVFTMMHKLIQILSHYASMIFNVFCIKNYSGNRVKICRQ